MGIVYQTDKRSGITYAYENQSFWDSELRRSRSKRKLIGRVDKETGEIIPTDGRCKKLSPDYIPREDEYTMPKTRKGLRDEVKRLLEENSVLREEVQDLKHKLNKTIDKLREGTYVDDEKAAHIRTINRLTQENQHM